MAAFFRRAAVGLRSQRWRVPQPDKGAVPHIQNGLRSSVGWLLPKWSLRSLRDYPPASQEVLKALSLPYDEPWIEFVEGFEAIDHCVRVDDRRLKVRQLAWQWLSKPEDELRRVGLPVSCPRSD